MESGIPEYSGLDLTFRGSLLQKTTEIDAKIKGDVKIVNDGESEADFIELLRVKSENLVIDVHAAHIFVKRYMEAKNLTITKKSKGDVKIKRLGISHKLDSSFVGTNIDIDSMWVHREPGNAAKISLENCKLRIGEFNGPLEIFAKDSTLDIDQCDIDS